MLIRSYRSCRRHGRRHHPSHVGRCGDNRSSLSPSSSLRSSWNVKKVLTMVTMTLMLMALMTFYGSDASPANLGLSSFILFVDAGAAVDAETAKHSPGPNHRRAVANGQVDQFTLEQFKVLDPSRCLLQTDAIEDCQFLNLDGSSGIPEVFFVPGFSDCQSFLFGEDFGDPFVDPTPPTCDDEFGLSSDLYCLDEFHNLYFSELGEVACADEPIECNCGDCSFVVNGARDIPLCCTMPKCVETGSCDLGIECQIAGNSFDNGFSFFNGIAREGKFQGVLEFFSLPYPLDIVNWFDPSKGMVPAGAPQVLNPQNGVVDAEIGPEVEFKFNSPAGSIDVDIDDTLTVTIQQTAQEGGPVSSDWFIKLYAPCEIQSLVKSVDNFPNGGVSGSLDSPFLPSELTFRWNGQEFEVGDVVVFIPEDAPFTTYTATFSYTCVGDVETSSVETVTGAETFSDALATAGLPIPAPTTTSISVSIAEPTRFDLPLASGTDGGVRQRQRKLGDDTTTNVDICAVGLGFEFTSTPQTGTIEVGIVTNDGTTSTVAAIQSSEIPEFVGIVSTQPGSSITSVTLSGFDATVVAITEVECPSGGGMHGDPHIVTWSGYHYDFQGECDLVMVDNPWFMDELGMHIHARTKLHGSWSAIASAAIQVGGDVLEVHGEDLPLFNGAPLSIPNNMSDGTEYAFPTSLGGFSLTLQRRGPHSRRFIIHLGEGERIFINNFKEFVDVDVESPRAAEFAGSNGLLGSWSKKGSMIGRDGASIIDDADSFGQEWQVQPTDPQLFSVLGDGPHYPSKCNMPAKLTAEQRHLRAMTKKISEDDAKKACAKAPASRKENCIADVFGSDDLEMVGIYVN